MRQQAALLAVLGHLAGLRAALAMLQQQGRSTGTGTDGGTNDDSAAPSSSYAQSMLSNSVLGSPEVSIRILSWCTVGDVR